MAIEQALFEEEVMRLVKHEMDEWASAKETEANELTEKFEREEREHGGLHRDFACVESSKRRAFGNLWATHRSERRSLKDNLLSRARSLCDHWGPLIDRAASRKKAGFQ